MYNSASQRSCLHTKLQFSQAEIQTTFGMANTRLCLDCEQIYCTRWGPSDLSLSSPDWGKTVAAVAAVVVAADIAGDVVADIDSVPFDVADADSDVAAALESTAVAVGRTAAVGTVGDTAVAVPPAIN